MRLSHLLIVVGTLAATTGGATSAYARSEVCKRVSEKEIAGLFDRWNASLQTGDAHKVVANYAPKSVLLPTLSNQPRLTAAEKEDYFEHFLQLSRLAPSTGEASRSTATPPLMPASTPSPWATAVSLRRATPILTSGTASSG